MRPETISEKLQYSTLRIETIDGSTGTGFFFTFKINRRSVPVIITNKHVINNNENENVSFYLHSKEIKYNEPSDEKINIDFNTRWYFHPTHDLAFCFAAPLFNRIKEMKKEVFYQAIDTDFIWNNYQLEELSAIEDVVMVGYPNGLWDEKNNLPLFRKGITSSHPAIDFNKKGVGVVDMACFPGSSGSPIFIMKENGYIDKFGNAYPHDRRIIFLGVLYAGPLFTAEGEIIITSATNQKMTTNTPMMINLGYYIKSVEILSFIPIIEILVAKR